MLLGQGERVRCPVEVERDEVGRGDAGEASSSQVLLLSLCSARVVVVVAFVVVAVSCFFLLFQVRVDVAHGKVVGKGRVAVGGDAGVLLKRVFCFFVFRESKKKEKSQKRRSTEEKNERKKLVVLSSLTANGTWLWSARLLIISS